LRNTGATRLGFVRRYPVVAFTILAMVLGGGTVYLVVQGVLPAGAALASALSASVAGVIMTAVADGSDGLRLIRPSLDNVTPGFELLPMFIGFFIVAGLGQELGWTGFLTPRLQARYSALTSSAIRAVLGGLWHLPLLLYSRFQLAALADFPYAGWIAQKGFLTAIGTLVLMFLVPWSIIYVWMFNNTRGSLLLVAVLHGSEIWVAYWMMSTGIDPRNLNNYWGYGAVVVVTAIVIVIATGPKNLSRRCERIVHQPSIRPNMPRESL